MVEGTDQGQYMMRQVPANKSVICLSYFFYHSLFYLFLKVPKANLENTRQNKIMPPTNDLRV